MIAREEGRWRDCLWRSDMISLSYFIHCITTLCFLIDLFFDIHSLFVWHDMSDSDNLILITFPRFLYELWAMRYDYNTMNLFLLTTLYQPWSCHCFSDIHSLYSMTDMSIWFWPSYIYNFFFFSFILLFLRSYDTMTFLFGQLYYQPWSTLEIKDWRYLNR